MAAGENRLGVPPPMKMRVHGAAPHQRQRGVEVGHQRVEVALLGQRVAAPLRHSCELKSQYGHLRRHHGRCT